RRNVRSAATQRVTTAIWLVFFVGLGTFPGCGLIACGLASGIIRLYDRHAKTDDRIEKHGVTTGDEEMPAVPNLQVEPLIHSLYGADLEARRAAVAELGRLGSPSAIELLRQLLTDPSPEVRHDASVMLTRLENELIQPLNATLALWETEASQSEHTYLLAEQYYRYAESNVLDTPSQYPYLFKARELLTEVLAHDDAHMAALMLRARVHLRLHEPGKAQQDIAQALKFQPAHADLTLLALESAYRARDWEAVITLARDTLASVTENTTIHQIARSWAAIASGGEVVHG
ncbi:MAG TPA: HEAT repeat domain-containing protein, partial [Ktedonobacterales bacterium]|nr:HEAT repeat domain-containing protein [Ktedonobacterales bacterium]